MESRAQGEGLGSAPLLKTKRVPLADPCRLFPGSPR